MIVKHLQDAHEASNSHSGGLETARNMKTQKSGGERGRRDEARKRKDARPSQLHLNSALSCHNADI